MEINDIKELIKLVDSSKLALFELSKNDLSIKMDKSFTRGHLDNINFVENSNSTDLKTFSEATIDESNTDSKIKSQEVKKHDDIDLHTISSPMVGSFYSSSGEGKAPFVIEGSVVKKGDILCIIEAMKLFNDIESEVDGEIVEVLVNNGDMVEFAQPLFKVRRD